MQSIALFLMIIFCILNGMCRLSAQIHIEGHPGGVQCFAPELHDSFRILCRESHRRNDFVIHGCWEGL